MLGGHLTKEEKEKLDRQTKFFEFEIQKQILKDISKKQDNSEEDFAGYIKMVRDSEDCKYMTGIKDLVDLCNHPQHVCKFRGKNNFTYRNTMKTECKRRETIKLKKLLV